MANAKSSKLVARFLWKNSYAVTQNVAPNCAQFVLGNFITLKTVQRSNKEFSVYRKIKVLDFALSV